MKFTPGMRFKIGDAIFDSMVECGSCGGWHPEDWYGDCRDDDHRGHPDDVLSLVMASPELLEACEKSLDWLKTLENLNIKYQSLNETIDFVQQTITKARYGT